VENAPRRGYSVLRPPTDDKSLEMKLLAIETSGTRGSLGLFDGTTCLRQSFFPEGLLHGREITVHLEQLLRLEGLEARSLEGVAVSVGPGSYTGTRVGVTAAKSLAYSLGIPLLGESSLRVIAANALATGALVADEGKGPARVLTLVDARRGAFFVGLFTVAAGPLAAGDDLVEAMTPISMGQARDIISIAEAAVANLRDGVLVVGDGADSFLEFIDDRERTNFCRGPSDWDVPRAGSLGYLTAQRLLSARFDLEAIHKLEPSYLRVSEAELRFSRRGRA